MQVPVSCDGPASVHAGRTHLHEAHLDRSQNERAACAAVAYCGAAEPTVSHALPFAREPPCGAAPPSGSAPTTCTSAHPAPAAEVASGVLSIAHILRLLLPPRALVDSGIERPAAAPALGTPFDDDGIWRPVRLDVPVCGPRHDSSTAIYMVVSYGRVLCFLLS